MRRIQPPKCTICKRASAMFESDVWRTLKLCHVCQSDALEYMIQFDCAIHGNPFAIELALPGDNGNREDAIRIWRKVPSQLSTYREYFIRLKAPESRMAVDNSLDILDAL